MVPWLNYDKILDRQRTYDLPKFKNEVLGLSTTTGENVVTREELEACCTDFPMTGGIDQLTMGNALMAGVDWGGGGTSRTAACHRVHAKRLHFPGLLDGAVHLERRPQPCADVDC